ncbi:MAG: glycosyltransferase family 2 protein, partial [Anaerolineae bacterium]
MRRCRRSIVRPAIGAARRLAQGARQARSPKVRERRNGLISIVVPARNERRSIGRCIEALLCQEGLSADWELIIVDDGSTDGTADVARG